MSCTQADLAANRQSILVDAAIAGLGVANLPTFLVEAPRQSGSLLQLLPDWEPAPIEMTALWQKDRITERLVKAIVAESSRRSSRPVHLSDP